VSSAGVAEPASDLSHDFVDLEWLQEVWFFLQLRTPFHQDPTPNLWLLIAFINNLLDGCFPFFKTYHLFLLDCGRVSCDFNRDVGVIEDDRIAKLLRWHKLSLDVYKARFPFSL
jgi:hypothetical protein